MRFISVCSGIEAASVAWGPLGWKPVMFSEIDPFASAVLAHHYPDVPNMGDMSKFKEWPDATIDVLCGGTPCQSFSVAGLRAGLADPRGNLMLTYLAIAQRYRPKWVVWENVPGVLSSGSGGDFAAFLGGLGQLGYGWAYRVLDAQHFGVPQRRRRVFVVGCLGDWRAAAAVLFDATSLRGDLAPRRESRKDIAPTLTRSALDGSSPCGGDGREGLMVSETVACLDASFGKLQGASGQDMNHGHSHLVPVAQAFDVANTLTARMHKGINSTVDEGQTPVLASALRAEGFDASEDGTGRQTLIPQIAPPLMAGMNRSGGHRFPGMAADDAAGLIPIPFDTTQITSATNRSNPQASDPCHPLAAGAHPPTIAFNGRQDPVSAEELSGPLDTHAGTQAIAFSCKDHGADAGEMAPTRRAMNSHASHPNGGGQVAVQQSTRVRRLTPRECERLQGFPDDYTLIAWRGKPTAACPDGPRYKALGNSWATPVAHWVGARIARVDQILKGAA